MSAKTVTALVPMKGHSQRVPNKNIRSLCDRPLFYWIVEALRRAGRVGEVVIETDSDRIEAMAKQEFGEIRVLRRPNTLCGDETPMNALLEWHQSQLGGDVFVQTHSTNPLLRPETIDAALERFFQPGGHDSLFTVTPMRTRFYWADGRPVNHNPEELIQTQNLPPLMEENSNLYVFTRQSFSRHGRRIGEAPLMFEMDPLEAVDIDEEHDFKLAELLMQQRLTGTGHA